MSFATHPHLWRVCRDMALGNGGIYRDRNETSFRRKAEPIVFALAHAPEDMATIETWLSTLSEIQLRELSDGEWNETRAILATCPVGDFLDGVLDRVFEEAV